MYKTLSDYRHILTTLVYLYAIGTQYVLDVLHNMQVRPFYDDVDALQNQQGGRIIVPESV